MYQSPMGWILVSVALDNVHADEAFCSRFPKVFRHARPKRRMITCRVVLRVSDSKKIGVKIV